MLHCSTVDPLRCCTADLLCRCTVELLYCCTVDLLYRYNADPLYRCTVDPLCCFAAVLLYRCTANSTSHFDISSQVLRKELIKLLYILCIKILKFAIALFARFDFWCFYDRNCILLSYFFQPCDRMSVVHGPIRDAKLRNPSRWLLA